MVADRCTNSLAARMASEMAFTTDSRWLRRELQLVDEMMQIVQMETEFPQQDYIDLTPTLSHLRMGNTAISPEALFDLKLSLRTIADCYRFLTSEEHLRYTALREEAIGIELGYGGSASQLNVINSLLGRLIDDHGDIYDNASPQLAEIRRTRTKKAAEIDAQISHALARAKREGWAADDAEVTLRDGRPVIPLLTTHRRRIRGLIQDESASHQTAFVEPAEVVELGNDLRELDFDERHEVQRLLLSFTDRIRPLLPQLDEAYRFLAKLDFLRAKAHCGLDLGGCVPQLTDRPMLDWLDARHPLLYLQKRDAVVPFSLQLGQPTQQENDSKETRIVIISGPNAGGKSVCLKAIGLIQYMLQCGLPVPLHPTSECGLFTNLFIDIGDQQSIDNDLSTYTSHLLNMKQLLDTATPGTLFLLDELGGGTEPRSGCAIAEALLEELYAKGSFGIATTHFADLKLLADRLPAVANAAMLFDTTAMRPLYRLSVGHPGSSFAFEIAESVGFPKEILQKAASKVGTAQLNFEHQLQQLETDKRDIARQREELRVADEFLSEITQKYQRLNAQLEERRHDIVGNARRQAQQILADSNRTVERTISDIKRSQAEKEATQAARSRLAEAAASNQAALQTLQATPPRPPQAPHQPKEPDLPITTGTIVRIDGQDTFGQVVEIKGSKAVVESNSLRLTLPLDRLTATRKQKLPTQGNSRPQSSLGDALEKRTHFNPTLDLRGKRADEAIDLLHRFLDDALLLGEKEVRILHGKGYGILMSIIRQQLNASPHVRRHRPERAELGGEGITVAELR